MGFNAAALSLEVIWTLSSKVLCLSPQHFLRHRCKWRKSKSHKHCLVRVFFRSGSSCRCFRRWFCISTCVLMMTTAWPRYALQCCSLSPVPGWTTKPCGYWTLAAIKSVCGTAGHPLWLLATCRYQICLQRRRPSAVATGHLPLSNLFAAPPATDMIPEARAGQWAYEPATSNFQPALYRAIFT